MPRTLSGDLRVCETHGMNWLEKMGLTPTPDPIEWPEALRLALVAAGIESEKAEAAKAELTRISKYNGQDRFK